MKLGLKIILPVLLLLLIILGSLGYLLYNLKQQETVISAEGLKVQKLNSLNEQLTKQQDQTDYYVLAYRFNQDRAFLLAISQAALDKSKTLDEMSPFITTPNGRELVSNYTDSRKEVESLRNGLIRAIDEGDEAQISLSYNKWQIKTQSIKVAFSNIKAYNINSLEKTLASVAAIGNKITQVIFVLGFVVMGTVLFLFFYLRAVITIPIIKLAEFADEVANQDFTTTTTTTTTTRGDEIGVLSRAFNEMATKLKESYRKKEDARLELEVTTEKLALKIKELVLIAKEKEDVRLKLVTTAEELKKSSEILEERVIERTNDLEHKEIDFLSMASHQLLTPLALIKGYTSMLISGKIGKIDTEAKKYLEESIRGGERMSNLIRSLLETSRLDSGNIKIVGVNFDLDELMQSVAAELKPKLEGKKLTMEVPTPKKLMVFADLEQTREVLQNVLDNAIKYSEAGTITITESQKDNMGIVSIQDSGIGINKKDLPHIFEKFYSSENWLQKQSESHGLGLYIAQLLLKLMGGSITVESKAGEGSTFSVSLPLAKNV